MCHEQKGGRTKKPARVGNADWLRRGCFALSLVFVHSAAPPLTSVLSSTYIARLLHYQVRRELLSGDLRVCLCMRVCVCPCVVAMCMAHVLTSRTCVFLFFFAHPPTLGRRVCRPLSAFVT